MTTLKCYDKNKDKCRKCPFINTDTQQINTDEKFINNCVKNNEELTCLPVKSEMTGLNHQEKK
jgi:hypothetical protein